VTGSCISELAIDRLVSGELPPPASNAIRHHAATCQRCGGLLADAVAAAQAFAAAPPPLRLPFASARRRLGLALASGAVAVAAVALVALVSRPGADAPGTRTKGSSILGFFVAHGGSVRRGGAGERLAPGDAIELYATTTEPRWLAVVSVDGAGARSVYVAPRLLPAGREQVVPQSIVLDATLGAETLTGIFCDAPFDPSAPPAGCTTDRIAIEKVAP